MEGASFDGYCSCETTMIVSRKEFSLGIAARRDSIIINSPLVAGIREERTVYLHT